MPCPTLRPSAPSREGSDRRTRERMPRMRCGKPPFQRQQFPAPPSRSDVALRRRAKPPSRRRARPQARKRSARDVPRPARPNAARAPKRADAAKPLVLATEPRSGTKTVEAFAMIWRRPGVSPAKASASAEAGGKTLPARARTRFRGQKSPFLLHGATRSPPDGSISGNRDLRKRGKKPREAPPSTIASQQMNAPATPHRNKGARPRHRDART